MSEELGRMSQEGRRENSMFLLLVTAGGAQFHQDL
jgi:hypothetical protein